MNRPRALAAVALAAAVLLGLAAPASAAGRAEPGPSVLAADAPSTSTPGADATQSTAPMAIESTPVTEEGSETSTAGLVVFVVVVAVVVGGAIVLYLRHRHTGRV